MRWNNDYNTEYGDNTQPPDPNNEENQEELIEGNNISDEGFLFFLHHFLA